MQLSPELVDVINCNPLMPSNRKFNEKIVTEGYLNPKIITFAVEIIMIKHVLTPL